MIFAERVLEPGIEPDLTPYTFDDWIHEPQSFSDGPVRVHPLAHVKCPLNIKDDIKKIMANYSFFTPLMWDEIIAKNKSEVCVHARAEIYELLLLRGWSYARIGKLMGNRKRDTIKQSVIRHTKRKESK